MEEAGRRDRGSQAFLSTQGSRLLLSAGSDSGQGDPGQGLRLCIPNLPPLPSPGDGDAAGARTTVRVAVFKGQKGAQ